MKAETVQDTLRELGVQLSDESITDYIVQLLQDDDAYSELDSLRETLQSFLAQERMDVDKEATSELAKTIVESLASTMIESSPLGGSRLSRSKDQAPPAVSHVGSVEVCDRCKDEGVDSKTKQSSEAEKKKNPRRQRGRKPQTTAKQRVAGAPSSSKSNADDNDEVLLEDEASAWKDCQKQGITWGGRGKGGRGEYAGAVNSVKSNIHLTNVSITLPNGNELLSHATMIIVKGHRYGLIGRNGVGKSTLLERISQKALAGMPHDMKVLLVQQQMEGNDQSAVDVLVQADTHRMALLREQEELERRLESEDVSTTCEELEEIGERLGDIAGELEAISADAAEDRAIEILRGLQFSDEMIFGPTSNLSGGWCMRLKLAQALFVPSDLICADECTNHLDLYGLDWLISYLNHDEDKTLIVVSHDRMFLDAVCTDIVVMEHQKLKYYAGNYSEYERQMQERAARESQILDSAERQRTKAQAFIQKQQQHANKKNADPNKQRQARMIKEKKLDRIGNYREDGKRYKLNSLKKLSEDYIRLAQKVVIEADDPVIKMYFPNPVWPPGISQHDSLIRLEEFEFGFTSDCVLLKDVTLSLNRGSKVALVGRNGCGKSTLMNLLAGELQCKNNNHSRGSLFVHPSIRLGHVTQYAVESLEQFAHQTVCQYAEDKIKSGRASADIIAKASGNVRQYLGAFGLGGKLAMQAIGKLSGGERMRLCFATVLADQPHLLLLDESTNHVDIETLDSMSKALNAFEGSVLMVSHNQGFLSGFCNELWILEGHRITVGHSDTETFDEMFSEYRSSLLNKNADKSLTSQRRETANRAKRANRQRAGTRQNTALL